MGQRRTGAYVAAGVALGISLGLMLNNLGAGIAIGIAIGIAMGVASTWVQGEENSYERILPQQNGCEETAGEQSTKTS